MRTCPQCRRPIEDEEALLCLYCGSSLKPSAPFLWVGLVGAVIIAFILFMMSH